MESYGNRRFTLMSIRVVLRLVLDRLPDMGCNVEMVKRFTPWFLSGLLSYTYLQSFKHFNNIKQLVCHPSVPLFSCINIS